MSDFISEQQCDEFTPEYEPTDQDYRDMAEAWGGFGHHADESMYDEEPEDLFTSDEW